MLKRLFVLLSLLVFLSSPAQAVTMITKPKPIAVVASFSILGQIISEVGGPDVKVTVLVAPNEDAHTFMPKPESLRAFADADLIAINGLQFENFMTRLIDASKSKAKLLVASAGIKPRIMQEDGHAIVDPHAWQDPRNVKRYVINIVSALIAVRPERRDVFADRAKAYMGKLDALDKKIRADLANVPAEKRKVITNHDAFGYFGAAYGVTFLSPEGLSTEAEPSAADVAKLIAQIKKEGVKTLFIENMVNPRLMQQIAQESKATLGGTLYADALSLPNQEAGTYLDMMELNAERMLAAMR